MGIFSGKKAKNKTDKKESLLVTKESLCSTCALFSLLALVILCTRSFMFGELGLAVHSFLTGVFGYLAYPLALGVLYLSLTGLIGKRFVKNRRLGVCVALAVVCVALIVHTALTFRWDRTGYVADCFLAGESFPNTTVAGVLGGLIVYAISSVMSSVGAIVIFSLFTAFFIYLSVVTAKTSVKGKTADVRETVRKEDAAPVETDTKSVYTQPTQGKPAATQQNVAQMQNTTPITPQVVQRPGVSIRDTASEQARTADVSYSPFGRSDMMASSDPAERQQTSRDILFGGDPAENFRRNLIFNPNSRSNTRPSVEPIQPAQDGYVPSYTEQYTEAVNSGETQRPPMTVVSDGYAGTSDIGYEDEYPEEVQPREESSISPMTYLEEEKPVAQEPAVYPPIEETVVEHSETETGVEATQSETQTENGEYRRHEYMEMFSPENPRLFGEETEQEPVATEKSEESAATPSVGFSVRGFAEEEPQTPAEEPTRRDGISLFDDEKEEDPYTLRSEIDSVEREEAIDDRRSIEDGRIVDRERFGSNRSDLTETPGTDRNGFREEFTENSSAADRGAFDGNRSARRVDFGKQDDFGLGERSTERAVTPPSQPEPKKAEPPKPRIIRPYKRVSLDDFDCRDIEPLQNDEEVEETKADIIATLEDFKIMGATIASVTFGPTVTRYNVALPRSVSPRKVVALDQSIALSLHSNGVNIYPNYEDGVVSIEVPNKQRQFVQLGCMLSGDTFVNAPKGALMFAMGKNVANAKVYGDINKMIHLLVAGSSGSGKSVFLGSLIISMIYKYSPEELRLILIDPKKTEFVLYNGLPHLMINEIITDVNKAVQSLNWAIGEMNRRYTLFEQMSRAGTYVVKLDEYNEQLEKNGQKNEKLPKIVIIIDELADLMLAAKNEIEEKIQNLTQKARAAGIHLIVATQRPSADVITGVIKSNLSTRVAFAVASEVDSRVILDQSGAQKLVGKGDLLYTMPGINAPVRVQSAFISSEDSQKVVNFIKANNEAYFDEEATAYINNTRSTGDDPASGDKGDVIDPIYIEALRHVILSGSASISMIQRKCSAGYNRAGKIIEWMEDMGYISAFDGAKARKVLITKEEFESKYGPL